MWSVLKKKMTKSAGYEMSDRESDSGDDCVVVLKKYTKIPSYAEGLSQETLITSAAAASGSTPVSRRYENPYEIEAPQPTDSNEEETTTTTTSEGRDQTPLVRTSPVDPTTTTMRVVDNQRDPGDTGRTSGDIENNNNHEDDHEEGFGAHYEQNEDVNANGGGRPHVVSRTVSDLRLEEGSMMLRGARLSPPRMKRREKQLPGVPQQHDDEDPKPCRHARVPRSERVHQSDSSYQNIHYDPRRRKKDHAPPPPPPPLPIPPPPPPLPRDFLSSTSEDETRSRSRSRHPRDFSVDNNHLYDRLPSMQQHCPLMNESITPDGVKSSSHQGTMESGYLTLEDVKAQLEQARALNLFRRDESDGRSNSSRYDGGSEITSEAEGGRDSEPTSSGGASFRFTDVSPSTTRNQQKTNRKSPKQKHPDRGDEEERMKSDSKTEKKDLDSAENTIVLLPSMMNETGKLQPCVKSSSSDGKQSTAKVVDGIPNGRELIEGGPSSGGSTLSAPETDEKDRKRQDMGRTMNCQTSATHELTSGENDLEEAEGSRGMRVEVLRAVPDEMTDVSEIRDVSEPTHMSWDELMQEAQILGIPLYRPAASLCRSDSDRRSSMSSSATSSDLSHASPLQSPKMNRLSGSGPWHRKDNSLKRAKDKTDKKNSPFKGKFKLQNLFAAKKAQAGSPKKKSDREPAQNLRGDTDKEAAKLDPIPFRATRLREFVRSGLESPVLHHYRSGPPSLRSDRGQNLVSELSENGFRNSTISLRSHVLSSSYSSGSLGSVFSRSSSQTPSSSSTSYGKTSASVESPGSSTGTSGSAAILHQHQHQHQHQHPIGQSSSSSSCSPPVILEQRSVTTTTTSVVPSSSSSCGVVVENNWFAHLLLPSNNFISSCVGSANTDFMIGLRQLKNCGWYWGPLGWEEAGLKLTNQPDGSFLVRDSSDDRYILSLSFRSQGLTHHTRIEHYKGVFSFYSQPRSHAASNIVDFIEKAMDQSRSNQYLYFLRPRVAGLPPVPVQLLFPVSRFTPIPSLKHICREFISTLVSRRDLVDQLPLTSSLRRYIKDSN